MEPILTPADVLELRAVQESAFNDACVITNATPIDDGAGGYRDAWTVSITAICAVVSPSRAVQTGLPVLDVGSDERQMVFCLPYDTAIRQGDRIVWSNRAFEAVSLEEPGSYPMQVTVNGLERRGWT